MYVVALPSFQFLLWIRLVCLIDVRRPCCGHACWFGLPRLLPDTLLFAGTLADALRILDSSHRTQKTAYPAHDGDTDFYARSCESVPPTVPKPECRNQSGKIAVPNRVSPRLNHGVFGRYRPLQQQNAACVVDCFGRKYFRSTKRVGCWRRD